MINDLVDLMLEHVPNQKQKDPRTYESRVEIVRRELGSRDAEAFTPQALETWRQITAGQAQPSIDTKRS